MKKIIVLLILLAVIPPAAMGESGDPPGFYKAKQEILYLDRITKRNAPFVEKALRLLLWRRSNLRFFWALDEVTDSVATLIDLSKTPMGKKFGWGPAVLFLFEIKEKKKKVRYSCYFMVGGTMPGLIVGKSKAKRDCQPPTEKSKFFPLKDAKVIDYVK